MTDQTCLLCDNPAIVGSSFCTSCLAEPADVAAADPVIAMSSVPVDEEPVPALAVAPISANSAPPVTFAEPPTADPFAAAQTAWVTKPAAPIALTEYPKFDHISLPSNSAQPNGVTPVIPIAPVRPTAELMGVGTSNKSKLVAGLLGIFFGGIGLHNFYLGRTKRGLTQLLVTVFASALSLGLASAAVSIWGLVEGISILLAKPGSQYYVDGNGRPLR